MAENKEDFAPDDNEDYNKKDYWDKRYEAEKEFDWLGDFQAFEHLFRRYAPPNEDESLLILGCGNSKLARQLWDAGYRNITSSDYSAVCIEAQRNLHMELGYRDIKWEVIDMTDMSDKIKVLFLASDFQTT